MAKIFIEISDKIKTKFLTICAIRGETQKTVLTRLIEKWLKSKKK